MKKTPKRGQRWTVAQLLRVVMRVRLHIEGHGRPPGRPKGAGVLSLKERFERFVKRGRPDDCWTWEGSTSKWKDEEGHNTKDGHGRIWDGHAVISAHHAAYIIEHGEAPPKGTYLRRACKNRLCVNPSHFEVVKTKKANPEC